jgi:flagellar biosynthesis anti-sigma factor FlgM
MPDPIHSVNPGNSVIVGSTGQAAAAPAPTSVSPAPTSSDSDSADVGQTQALLQTITAAAAGVPTIDQNRVASLQQALASGTYQPDPQAIAQKLIETESALGPSGTGS